MLREIFLTFNYAVSWLIHYYISSLTCKLNINFYFFFLHVYVWLDFFLCVYHSTTFIFQIQPPNIVKVQFGAKVICSKMIFLNDKKLIGICV